MLSASPNPPPPTVFKADHPFTFAISNKNGDILFSGVVHGL